MVLAFVFASFLALVPLLVAAVSILSTFLVLLGLAQLTDVSFVVQFLVGLIGLGVAIDYSLLLVIRWREERSNGLEGDEAIEAAMATSGRAIVFSGTTVGIGLLALVVVPVPFIRSIGFGGMLIPLLSVLRLRHAAARSCCAASASASPGRGAAASTRRAAPGRAGRGWVARRDVLAAGGGLLVIGALAVAALGLRPGDPTLDALATSGPARDALVALERCGGGPGTLTPIEVVADAGEAGEPELEGVEGVQAVAAGGESGGRALLHVIPRPDGATEAGADVRERVGEVAHRADAVVGGRDAQTADLADAIYGSFPVMIALIAVITFVLLARAFRSILLPLKAVVLNVLSRGGVVGRGRCWCGSSATGPRRCSASRATDAITAWVPLAIFAFLYGLSMDYEVFILARVREAYDETGDTREAVVRGLGRTGRLVTSAALILFLAFVALAASPGHGDQGAGHRPGRRHPARRHRRAGADRARAGDAVRALELVARARAGRACCACPPSDP